MKYIWAVRSVQATCAVVIDESATIVGGAIAIAMRSIPKNRWA
jgi:hypothetical protein